MKTLLFLFLNLLLAIVGLILYLLNAPTTITTTILIICIISTMIISIKENI